MQFTSLKGYAKDREPFFFHLCFVTEIYFGSTQMEILCHWRAQLLAADRALFLKSASVSEVDPLYEPPPPKVAQNPILPPLPEKNV